MLQQSTIVELGNLPQHDILNGIQPHPWTAMVNHFRFEQANYGLDQHIIVGVAGGTD